MRLDNNGRPIKDYPTIAPCGLACGFCPRYYTEGPSRCPGCCGLGFFEKHPTCSFITCCVKTRQHEVCAECEDFPCSRFRTEDEYRQMRGGPSYPCSQCVLSNLTTIREIGIKKYIAQQNKRLRLLKRMLTEYDDGRSKSFYCRVAERLEERAIVKALREADHQCATHRVFQDNPRERAKILRSFLEKGGREFPGTW